MRVFVAGGTGAIGHHLIPQLVAAGHDVTATTTKSAKLDLLSSWGADGVVVDGLDAQGLIQAVCDAKPNVVVHEMTAITSNDFRHFDRMFAATNRLRTEGTDNLLNAARAAGVRRVVAQSFCGWTSPATGTRLATETDPLDSSPVKGMEETLAAIRHLEKVVTTAADIEGLVLRYGGFYGPEALQTMEAVRKRQMPLIGKGDGVMPLVHLADAASATVAAVEHGAPGIYQIVDDDPAPFKEWLPYLAEALGAKPPLHLPTWVARLAAGPTAVRLLTGSRGASNAKAKADLGWTLRYPSWKAGFRTGLAAPPAASAPPLGRRVA